MQGLTLLKNSLAFFKKKASGPRWKNYEYFDAGWKERIHQLASFIEDEQVILDLGCGPMWLREMLPPGIHYMGCDYTKREDTTLICDFNKKEFPAVQADACFVSGVLEYVEDPDWFLDRICACCDALLLSYCTTDYHPDRRSRASLHWVNHLSFTELMDKMEARGFILCKRGMAGRNELMKFKAGPRRSRNYRMKKIAVFDTSVSNYNLGNQIIMDSVYKHLKDIFPMDFFFKLPNMEITDHTLKYIEWSDLLFFGGTNALCGEMDKHSQWGLNETNYSKIPNVVLMGIGWWQYQDVINRYTRKLLTNCLSYSYLHSVRDSYTGAKLNSLGFSNVINTGCPTLWGLTKEHCVDIPQHKAEEVVFTTTDYMKNLQRDKAIFEALDNNYKRIYVWIQGKGDNDYVNDHFNSQKVEIIGPDLNYYDDLLSRVEVDYVGTRLHAGIRALQRKRRTLIIGIDNRALEMHRDFNIPVLAEQNLAELNKRINASFETQIILPLDQIDLWKKQFCSKKGKTGNDEVC